MKYLRTSDVARAVGVHPNTVRRYVDRGRLPPVEYSPSGYRRFTQLHIDCLRVAWLVYGSQFPGKAIRQLGVRIVQATASGDLEGALELAHSHLALVQAERIQADLAAALLERWASHLPIESTMQPLQIGQVASLLGVSIDVLRNWDRSGLIDVPRDPANGYRRYGMQEISRLRIIRMLSRAGYSMSAILRMLIQLDRGDRTNLRRALDTPRPDEDVYTASDRWLSTLADQERLHNLKNVTLTIPKSQLVVLTGLSGSGKSTLGFDILHKEGQRQYVEALGMVPFGLAKAPVDAITGLSPSISIDQHLTNRSPRSTVGTVTDVYTYLRVLFARLGHRPCPKCGKDVAPSFDPANTEWEGDTGTDDDVSAPGETFPCLHCGAPVPEISMAHFSFNKPEGACPTCTGLGFVQQANIKRLVDEQKSILEDAVAGWNTFHINYNTSILRAAAAHYGFDFDFSLPVKDYTQAQRDLLFYGMDSPRFQRHFPAIKPPATVRQGRFEGIATSLLRRYNEHLHEHVQEADYRDKLEEFLVTQTCPDCGGTRLRAESRVVTVNGRTVIALSRLPLDDLGAWLRDLPAMLSSDEMLVAELVLLSLNEGISRLIEVGAGYLSLERSTPTLSAGETQRLRLASLLGSALSGVLYVFDEPTIGLHPRDTHRLVGVLRRLRDLDNTVLVIEHDLEMITAADYVIDFGPGAGKHGGQVVAAGLPS